MCKTWPPSSQTTQCIKKPKPSIYADPHPLTRLPLLHALSPWTDTKFSDRYIIGQKFITRKFLPTSDISHSSPNMQYSFPCTAQQITPRSNTWERDSLPEHNKFLSGWTVTEHTQRYIFDLKFSYIPLPMCKWLTSRPLNWLNKWLWYYDYPCRIYIYDTVKTG